MPNSSGWESVRLGDLVEIRHGWPFRGELLSAQLTGLPIVINIGNFEYSGGFRFESTVAREYRGEYPQEYELTPGDILLVMTCQTQGGEILGIPAKVPSDGRVYLHNQRLGRVVIRDGVRADLNFLYWVFLWPEFNRELFLTASGTKILHTAPTRIEAFRLSLPSASEQAQIAEILDALVAKIDLNRRMNENLEAIARAFFKSWFVDFDPVRKVEPGTVAVIGTDQRGWELTSLDTIAVFLNGLAMQRFPAQDGAGFLPVIKIAELRRGDTVGSDRASLEVPEDYVIEDGTVLFSWSGSLEVVVWTGGRGALNQHVFKVSSEKYPKWFYLHWIKQHLPAFRAIAADKATTMGHIQRRHLTEALVAMPPADVLEQMDPVMGPLLDRQISNNLESKTLATLRDTLLPKLLSGEIRVKQAEKMVGEAV